jgi:hypothetical protein
MALQNEEIDLARYKSAAAEVDSPSRDEGLWIKAYAESGGDEKSSRALYIKLRVEQLRRKAVADAARRVVGQATAAPSANATVAEASPIPTRATTPPPPPANHQGPARVAQTLYDIVRVDRHADVAVISAAIQAKNAQGADSSVTSEDRQRRGILLQNAAEVLLNVEKRRTYDERVFRAETAAPASPTSTEIPRAAYASQPVSGMIDEEEMEETPTVGKRWAAYAGWFVVWFVFHTFVVTPVLKAQMGWLLGAVAMGCNLALFLSGIALLRRKFNVANGDDARKVWIILGLSVLVLMGLRSYAAMRTNQAAKAAAVAAEVARSNATAAADARRIAAENAAAENARRLASSEDGGAATEYQKSLQASENYGRGVYMERMEQLRRNIANGTAGQGAAAELADMGMTLARMSAGHKVAQHPNPSPSPNLKPSTITRCDSGGCYDNLGGFYPSAGGAQFRGPGGQTCQMANGNMTCF